MNYSHKIYLLRATLRLKQSEFAARLSDETNTVTAVAVSHWEQGKRRPNGRNARQLIKLAQEVNIILTLDELIWG